MKKLTFFIITFIPLFALSQTKYITVSNGDWDKNATWQTTAPPTTIQEGDSVIISHTVNLKSDVTNKGVIFVKPNGEFNASNRRLTNEGIAVFDGNANIKYITTQKGAFFNTNSTLTNGSSFSVKDSSQITLNGPANLTTVLVYHKSNFSLNGNTNISSSLHLEQNSQLTINANTEIEYFYLKDNSVATLNDTTIIDKNLLQKDNSIVNVNDYFKTKYGYLEGGSFYAFGDVVSEQDFKINGSDSVYLDKNLSVGRYFDLFSENLTIGGNLTVENNTNIKNNSSLNILGNAQNYFGRYFTLENSTFYAEGTVEVKKDLRNTSSIATYDDSLIVGEHAYITNSTFSSKKHIDVDRSLRFTGTTTASLIGDLVVGKDLFFSNTANASIEGDVTAEDIEFYSDAQFTVLGNVTTSKDINVRNNGGLSISGTVVSEDLTLSGSSLTNINGSITLSNNLTLNNTSTLFTQSYLEANKVETYGGKLHLGGYLKADNLVRFRNLDSLFVNGDLSAKGHLYFQVISNGIISGNLDLDKKLYVQDNSKVKVNGNGFNSIAEDIYINKGDLTFSGSFQVNRDVTMYNGSFSYPDSAFIGDDFYVNNSTVETTGSKFTSVGKKLSIQNNSDFDTDGYLEVFGEVDINLNQPNEISLGGDVLFDDNLKLNNKAILKLGPNSNVYITKDLINYGDSILQYGLLTVGDDYKNHNPAKHLIDNNAKTKIKSLEISGNGIENNGVLMIENGGKIYGGAVVDGSGVFQVDGGLQVWGTVGGSQDVCASDGVSNPFTRGTVSGAATICNDPLNFQQIGPAPLPVDLLAFEATLAEENIVELFWVTASEVNNDYFTVEKANDESEFSEIMTVEGAGTTNIKQVYEATDENQCEGICYYRLSQTDYDGKTTVYDPVGVVVEEKNLNLQEVNLYPNPLINGNSVNIEMPITENQEVNFFINDLVGREYISDIMWINMGDHSLIILEFNQKLPKGVYLISMIVNKEIISKKLYVE